MVDLRNNVLKYRFRQSVLPSFSNRTWKELGKWSFNEDTGVQGGVKAKEDTSYNLYENLLTKIRTSFSKFRRVLTLTFRPGPRFGSFRPSDRTYRGLVVPSTPVLQLMDGRGGLWRPISSRGRRGYKERLTNPKTHKKSSVHNIVVSTPDGPLAVTLV